jgi:hypothetical protein
MSVLTLSPKMAIGPSTPRAASTEELRLIVNQVDQLAKLNANVQSAEVFTHPARDTVRCAVVSRERAYDSALDEAVSTLDLHLASDALLAGIDIEFRLFFAATLDQVAIWLKGWEPWADA